MSYLVYAADYGQTVYGEKTVKFGMCKKSRLRIRMRENARTLPYKLLATREYSHRTLAKTVESFILDITKPYAISKSKPVSEYRLADEDGKSYEVLQLAKNLGNSTVGFSKNLCSEILPRLLRITQKPDFSGDLTLAKLNRALIVFHELATIDTWSFFLTGKNGLSMMPRVNDACEKQIGHHLGEDWMGYQNRTERFNDTHLAMRLLVRKGDMDVDEASELLGFNPAVYSFKTSDNGDGKEYTTEKQKDIIWTLLNDWRRKITLDAIRKKSPIQ